MPRKVVVPSSRKRSGARLLQDPGDGGFGITPPWDDPFSRIQSGGAANILDTLRRRHGYPIRKHGTRGGS